MRPDAPFLAHAAALGLPAALRDCARPSEPETPASKSAAHSDLPKSAAELLDRAMSLACLNVLQDHIYLKEKTTKIT